jgi:hypothetical protein
LLVAGCGGGTSHTAGTASATTRTAAASTPSSAGHHTRPAPVTPATPISPAPTTVVLSEVDWANAQYPLTCFDGVAQVIAMHNSTGEGNGYQFTVQPPIMGEFGDQYVAVVRAACSGANNSPDSVLVYAPAPGQPRFLGYLLQPADNEHIQNISFQDDAIYLEAKGYSKDAPLCCPDLDISTVWSLQDGHTLRRVSTDIEPAQSVQPAADVSRQWACEQVRLVQQQIVQIRNQITSLQGGSVEGIPTYDEADAINNYSQIGPLQRQVFTYQQQLPGLSAACSGN